MPYRSSCSKILNGSGNAVGKSKVADEKVAKVVVPFLLRLPPRKHAALKHFADQTGRSLHSAIIYLATTNPDFVQHVRFAPPEVAA